MKKASSLKTSGIITLSLVELLTVVAIIAILATIFLTINVSTSIKKARDSKRKQDLAKLAKIMEDYYNDHSGYPPGGTGGKITNEAPWGSPFDPYVPLLPKDPQSPKQEYYYQGSPSQNIFIIYARLENNGDPDIKTVGCSAGCGPDHAYNYFVASPNVVMLADNPTEITPTPIGGDTGTPAQPPSEPTSELPTLSPTPTGPTPTPLGGGGPLPTPTRPPGAECDHNQCCLNKLCGGGVDSGGVLCLNREKCYYDPLWGWACWFDSNCP